MDLPIDAEADQESKDVKMPILSKTVEDEQCALLALDGFLLVLSDDGDITYVSENIADVLGLSKVRNFSGIMKEPSLATRFVPDRHAGPIDLGLHARVRPRRAARDFKRPQNVAIGGAEWIEIG